MQQLANICRAQMHMAHMQDVVKQQPICVDKLQVAPMLCIPIELDLSWRMCRRVDRYPSSLTTSFRGSRPSGRICSACGLKRTCKAITCAAADTYLPAVVGLPVVLRKLSLFASKCMDCTSCAAAPKHAKASTGWKSSAVDSSELLQVCCSSSKLINKQCRPVVCPGRSLSASQAACGAKRGSRSCRSTAFRSSAACSSSGKYRLQERGGPASLLLISACCIPLSPSWPVSSPD